MAAGSLLNIGVSGLNANQASLRTAGHNIANTDTPGYTRQRVALSTQNAGFSGVGYQGTGVQVETITRVVDDYVVNQLRLDTSAFNELNTYLSNSEQVDALLADTSTGIAPGVQSFFSALNGAADDPSSIPARQLVINEADGLVDRFEAVQTRLEQHNDTLNQQMETIAETVTSIANGLANLNNNIVSASSRGQDAPPNDLLDARDELLRQLSAYVSVSVVQQSDNAVDVFIGNGQPLVVGSVASKLEAVRGDRDPFRNDLAFTTGSSQQIVTSMISGGELGGILEFREEVLDKATNSVGRLALTVSDAINEQHELGLDLDGLFGGLFFADINNTDAMRARVVGDKDNALGVETIMSVSIDDINALTESDYVLAFSGPGDDRYAVTRLEDNVVVKQGILVGALPEEIEIDGFKLTIEAGGPKEGDSYLIQPTRYGARDMGLEIDRADRLALASAISAESSLGNSGSAQITNSEVLDVTTPAFLERGELAPPIVIVFTSPTTYDVLDNTDPAHPKDLDPPLRSLSFTPGIRNEMLPSGPGQTSVQSNGYLSGRLPEQFVLTPTEGPTTNGYVDEQITVSFVDPDTGIRSVQPNVKIEAGESARAIASKLSGLNGVSATARTEVSITDITNHPDGGALPLTISINGIQVNQPSEPDHPTLLTPNYLADTINGNPEFAKLGISALSDGETLRLISATGEDINVAVRGDVGDTFKLSDTQGNTLLMQGAGGSTPALIEGTADLSAGYDLSVDGPYRMSLKLGNGTTEVITVGGNQVLGRDVVSELQRAIDQSNITPGDVRVTMDTQGRISLSTRATGPESMLEIVDVTGPFKNTFGLSPSASQGADVKNEATVGGVLSVVMEEGVSLASDAIPAGGNLFTSAPESKSIFLGYQITVDGLAEVGDKFTVEFNNNGVSDNRNALQLTAVETRKLLDDSSVDVLNSYGKLVEYVGSVTSQAQINSEASESLMQQSQLKRDSLAGVSLDEEAADLIKYELAYNASAQVITIARSLFDTLINTFR